MPYIALQSNATDPGFINLRSSGGAAMTSGTQMGTFSFGGFDGTAWATNGPSSGIRGVATENWSTSGNGSLLQLFTTLNGTISNKVRMSITHDGHVLVGEEGTPYISGSAKTLLVSAYPPSAINGLELPASLELHGGSSTNGGLQSKIDFVARSTSGGDNNTARIEVTNTSNTAQGKMLFYTKGAGSLTERMRIEAGGNVGIGVTNPAQKLDVGGSIQYSGAIMPNGLAGTNGYLLTSTGGGVNTWTDPSTLVTGSAWGLTGNSGTNASTNFVGTSDAADLVLRSNNLERARFGTGGGISMGDISSASGTSAFALGTNAVASGNRAFAIGNNVTASNLGSFVLGDYAGNSPAPTSSSLSDQMTMRFGNGYRFYTSSTALTQANTIYFNPNGRVGIGTINTISKLQVAGDIGLNDGSLATNDAVTIMLVNRTGSASVKGEIVIVDVTNDNSFVKTNSPGHTAVIGVVYENGISTGSPCRVAIAGVVDVIADVAVTRGQHVTTGTTAGRAGSVAIPGNGASIGVWLTAPAAGAQGKVLLK